jgi:LysR family transcriptional activator of nhaA
VRRHYGVSILGRTSEIVERFYVISVERKIKHPAVIAISERARQTLSGEDQPAARRPVA